jgi:hypothetical protein
LVDKVNHTNKMNRSILKQLNKELNKNSYVRRIQSGKVFFGVSLSTLTDPNKVNNADVFSELEVDGDGSLKITEKDRKHVRSINLEENFGVTMKLTQNVEQSDDYTFLIKIEEIELQKHDDSDKPVIRVKSNCIMPFWIDGSNETFITIQQSAVEQCIDCALGIIVNTSDVEFGGVIYEGCGEYMDVSDRRTLVKQLPSL